MTHTRPRKITVQTKHGPFEGVPNTQWIELVPFWPDIVASIIEVILEDEFVLETVRRDNPRGFIASTYYWRKHRKERNKYPLKEAKRFIENLKQKNRFCKAIRDFNRGHGIDWLSEDSISVLGGYIYSFCFQILDYLNGLKKT